MGFRINVSYWAEKMVAAANRKDWAECYRLDELLHGNGVLEKWRIWKEK